MSSVEINKAQQELFNLQRERGLKDFFYFNKEILGYTPTEYTHGELHEYMAKPNRRKLILLPRYSYKTSLVTVGYSIWRICQDPNIRILIESETRGQGVDILRMIKSHLEGNELLRSLYGEFDADKDRRIWREDAIEVAQRTLVDRNPTIGVGSLQKVNVGAHYDIVIADDWVSDQNTMTSDQIQKTIDHWKAIHSVLSPRGKMIIVGTRWCYDDLYGYIIDNEELAKEYEPFVRSCYNEDGSLFFPEELTEDFLRIQRATQGEYLFSCLYKNDPVPVEHQDFKQEWIQYFNESDLEGKQLEYYFTIDPAISQRKSACDTVVLVCATDRMNNLYVIDYVRDRLKPNEIIEHTYRFAEEYPPVIVGVEMNAYQEALNYAFQDEANERNWWLPIKPIYSKHDKETRIRSIQPRFASGKVFIKHTMTDLVRDLMRFPRVANNKLDLLDCLSLQMYIVRRRSNPISLKRRDTRPTFDDIMGAMKQAEEMKYKMGNEGITFTEAFQSVRS